MSRSATQPPSIPASSGTASSRTVSIKTNTSLHMSDIKLYITNLRLLDLDLRPGWPQISVQTFSSKNAGQKQRIGGVEWSLFRLFEIWDPQETAPKLQPFFPPLEPLQSLNLRAALYRCLNELKKNGVLGRETVLRKTMLDECKGDKFFEVLAVFSTVVLRRTLSLRADTAQTPPIARRLATATTLPTDERALLLPLAIAHKAALDRLLRRKNEKRRRFADFEQLLDSKAIALDRKAAQSKGTRGDAPARSKDTSSVKKQLTDNWVGQQKWLDAILHGDVMQESDVILDMQYDDAWVLVESRTGAENAAKAVSPLVSLQLRVREQQERLKVWKDFNDSLRHQHRSSVPKSLPTEMSTTPLQFEEHRSLQLPPKEARGEAISKKPFGSEYQHVLLDMDTEIVSSVATPTSSDATLVEGPSTGSSITPLPQSVDLLADSLANMKLRHASHDVSIQSTPQVQPTFTDPPTQWPSDTPTMDLPQNAEDELAEQIITSVGNATPSPVKKQPPLSLAERTLLSMVPSVVLPKADTGTHTTSTESPRLPQMPPQSKPAVDPEDSLLERTRLTIAAMSLKQRDPERRREVHKSKSRQSLYPVNQFDTPRSRKSIQMAEQSNSGHTTPKEMLFSDDVEYESVFKSRPRVAHSPVSAQEVVGGFDYDQDFEEGVTGVDLADVDAGYDKYSGSWDDSPSKNAAGRRGKRGLFA
ncbi:hypothetical protein M011DRAFT_451309 [Sporormia fimetaria CBS 119925]|uniref:HAUS augmin-like complex subunit 6 N-terminal domain-containing protein n=1 Tax=Sporormia fimetaria CBS 119925 TaxID=1340428 RepID=A0A6A6UYU4_9PLEO|nr:hypothetical protein M011DRAFT_451309 [Sporormia fimetaria CBS 119925]